MPSSKFTLYRLSDLAENVMIMVMSRRIIRYGGHKENGIFHSKLKFCEDSYWVGPAQFKI